MPPARSGAARQYAGTAMSDPAHPKGNLRDGWLESPHPSRFGSDNVDFGRAMAAHREAVQAGQPGYFDPGTGLFVMTAAYLRQRGWCCDCGCRHCPYVI